MTENEKLIDIEEMIKKLKSPDVSNDDIRLALIAALCMGKKGEHIDVVIQDFKAEK